MAYTFHDLFNDTTGTLLENHTPDVGTSWSILYDSFTTAVVEINADGTVSPDTGNNGTGRAYRISPAPSGADIAIEADVYETDWTRINSYNRGLFARSSGTDGLTHYAVSILPNGHSDPSIRLYKTTSGSSTLLGSYDHDFVNGDVVRFECYDSAKKVYVNGVERISSTDNTVTGAGDAGLFWGNWGGANGGGHPDRRSFFGFFGTEEASANPTIETSPAILLAVGRHASIGGKLDIPTPAAVADTAGRKASITNIQVNGYEVQRQEDSGDWHTIAAGLLTETYDDTDDLQDGVTYCYRVRLWTQGQPGVWSNEDCVVFSAGVAVTADFAGLASAGHGTAVTPGAAVISSSVAAPAVTAFPIEILPGGATVTTVAAVLSSAGYAAETVSTAAVPVPAVELAAGGYLIEIIPGEAAVGAGVATLTSQGHAIDSIVPGETSIESAVGTLSAATFQGAATVDAGIQIAVAALVATEYSITLETGPTVVTTGAGAAVLQPHAIDVSGVYNVQVNGALLAALGLPIDLLVGGTTVAVETSILGALGHATGVISVPPMTVIVQSGELSSGGLSVQIVPGATSVTVSQAEAALSSLPANVGTGETVVGAGVGTLSSAGYSTSVLREQIAFSGVGEAAFEGQTSAVIPGGAVVLLDVGEGVFATYSSAVTSTAGVGAGIGEGAVDTYTAAVVPGETTLEAGTADLVGYGLSLTVFPGEVAVTAGVKNISVVGYPAALSSAAIIECSTAGLDLFTYPTTFQLGGTVIPTQAGIGTFQGHAALVSFDFCLVVTANLIQEIVDTDLLLELPAATLEIINQPLTQVLIDGIIADVITEDVKAVLIPC